MFSKLEIVPRWIIFTIDICLSVFALLLAEIVRHNFLIDSIDALSLYKSVILTIIINTLVFFNIKTFAGIVRYTSAQDSFRILFAITLASLAVFFSNALVVVFFGQSLISNVTIIIYSLFSFLFLITYRVIVKYFFMYIKNAKLDKIRIIIYGAGEAGVATKRTFDHDNKVNKTIIAFVDDDLRKVGKAIDGVKILDAASLENLIIKHEVDEIIFASYTIPSERKEQIVDVCLENDVRILNIPPPDVWARGDVSTAQIQNLNIEDLLNRKSIQIDIDGIQDQLKGKRILITGAAGSIGSEIVRQLMKFETGLIIMCDQSETGLHTLYLELEETHKNTNFHAFIGDVKDEKRMQFLFDLFKPHYVYHAAAYKHVPMMEDNPAEAIKTNVLGTKTIADLSVRHGVQKFVMISTDKAVNPTNIMGASKRIAEIYVQSLNNSLSNDGVIFSNGLSYLNESDVKPITKFITTRFGNVLGSNGSVIPRFKQQIEKGGPVTVTHPEITRYFMTIPEACRLVLEAGCMGKGGEIFVFDMGKSVKIVELAKKMIRLAGLVPNEDIKITYSGLRPGEKLYEELLNDNENTMPTHHEKIMIGKVREYVFNEIEAQIYQLLDHAIINDNRKVVIQMKTIVPEFKSKNSKFEEFDQIG
ncbi:polysaccharide biosynthesis protein [Pedobacter psychroterrae]|uniref:Polysaccharide biosynthesis protein n=1 Tax=Pedobacter psychroterrae TaxID=2530453 RepID=A0A4R0NP19_9SPHI|nr:nucleoside-diphosphate sugar epimerase/dehydratase [Pedobacter psychroterrae]TCD02661.1 polysaccharide biosynthesis protein [Pedobacter psychroterrae]